MLVLLPGLCRLWAKVPIKLSLGGTHLARLLGPAAPQRVVHMDLKSANVLLTGTGTAKVADVGVARLRHATYLSELPTAVGTFSWCAPGPGCGGAAAGSSPLELLAPPSCRPYQALPTFFLTLFLPGPGAQDGARGHHRPALHLGCGHLLVRRGELAVCSLSCMRWLHTHARGMRAAALPATLPCLRPIWHCPATWACRCCGRSPQGSGRTAER